TAHHVAIGPDMAFRATADEVFAGRERQAFADGLSLDHAQLDSHRRVAVLISHFPPPRSIRLVRFGNCALAMHAGDASLFWTELSHLATNGARFLSDPHLLLIIRCLCLAQNRKSQAPAGSGQG